MEITLHYLESNDKLLQDSLLVEAIHGSSKTISLKDRALARLGIERKENEKPLEAWIRHLQEINSLDFVLPAQNELVDAILFNSNAKRFMFWLA